MGRKSVEIFHRKSRPKDLTGVFETSEATTLRGPGIPFVFIIKVFTTCSSESLYILLE